MTRRLVSSILTIGLGVLIVAAHPVRAVQCPGPDGAQVKVCVTNPTSGFPTITLSGNIVTGKHTCTTALDTFSTNRTFTMNNGATECFEPVPTDTASQNDLLRTGLWVMKISYNTTVNGVAGGRYHCHPVPEDARSLQQRRASKTYGGELDVLPERLQRQQHRRWIHWGVQ